MTDNYDMVMSAHYARLWEEQEAEYWADQERRWEEQVKQDEKDLQEVLDTAIPVE